MSACGTASGLLQSELAHHNLPQYCCRDTRSSGLETVERSAEQVECSDAIGTLVAKMSVVGLSQKSGLYACPVEDVLVSVSLVAGHTPAADIPNHPEAAVNSSTLVVDPLGWSIAAVDSRTQAQLDAWWASRKAALHQMAGTAGCPWCYRRRCRCRKVDRRMASTTGSQMAAT